LFYSSDPTVCLSNRLVRSGLTPIRPNSLDRGQNRYHRRTEYELQQVLPDEAKEGEREVDCTRISLESREQESVVDIRESLFAIIW
jgi:hypothetical protein